jgi:hypothetical protein
VANESAIASSGVMAHPRCARATDLDRNYSATVVVRPVAKQWTRRETSRSPRDVNFRRNLRFFADLRGTCLARPPHGAMRRNGKPLLFALGGKGALAYIETLL